MHNKVLIYKNSVIENNRILIELPREVGSKSSNLPKDEKVIEKTKSSKVVQQFQELQIQRKVGFKYPTVRTMKTFSNKRKK
jgi:hypothetical protein